MLSEIVVLDPARVDGLIYLRKLSMQLASKMRFTSAQLLTLLEDDLGIESDERVTEVLRIAGNRNLALLEVTRNELDRRTGKLSEADWRSTDRSLRAEAVALLKRLDQVEGRAEPLP